MDTEVILDIRPMNHTLDYAAQHNLSLLQINKRQMPLSCQKHCTLACGVSTNH